MRHLKNFPFGKNLTRCLQMSIETSRSVRIYSNKGDTPYSYVRRFTAMGVEIAEGTLLSEAMHEIADKMEELICERDSLKAERDELKWMREGLEK